MGCDVPRVLPHYLEGANDWGRGAGGAFWASESADSATEHARRPTWRERGHACRYRFVFMSSILLSSANR